MSDGTYGVGQDQIDPFFKEKRSWSKVKDEIVSKYVACYLKTVHKLNHPIVLVDAFSGPGVFGDGSDGSPVMICKAITEMTKGRQGAKCVFSDSRRAHRVQLERNLAPFSKAGLCGAPFGECSEAIAHSIDTYRDSTVFFYLDPFGIRDIDFEMIRQIFQRNPSRSTEVLINFNFRTFMRMSGNWNYAASAQEVAEKVKASKVETVNQAMGGDYWQAIVLDPKLNKLDREDAVVQAYLCQLKKYVRFAFAIPVKERTSDQLSVPVDELAHYHLIFGTRSPKAVEYMNDVALNALEPYLSQFADGLLFDLTPDRYKPAARSEVKEFIVSSVQVRGQLRRPEIYDLVVPEYFRQYRLKDYRAMISELVFTEHRLFPDAMSMKRVNQLNDAVLLSAESTQNQLFCRV
jgi:three-Cys-motif partner protein